MTGPVKSLGLELENGHAIGRDPRDMSQDELREIGHERMSPLKALRLRCVDCCAGSTYEVRACVAVDCPSWPFRMGKNPWREKRQLSDEQRAAMAERGRKLHRRPLESPGVL